jgi:hypothetical protein
VSIPPCWRGWDVGSPRFVITGTGHHGSAFIAEVLWRAGVRCGHEQWFVLPGAEQVDHLDGDSSWLALSQLGSFGGLVVLQVRHPLTCIGSLARYLATAPDDAYRAERERWFDPAGDHVADAARCWVEMNAAGASQADVVWRVENVAAVHVQILGRLADVAIPTEQACDALLSTPTDANSHGRDPLSWDDLERVGVAAEVSAMSRAFGYGR